MTDTFVIYREVSDQYGTDEVIGVCSSLERAIAFEKTIRNRRTFTRRFEIDRNAPSKGDVVSSDGEQR